MPEATYFIELEENNWVGILNAVHRFVARRGGWNTSTLVCCRRWQWLGKFQAKSADSSKSEHLRMLLNIHTANK